MLVKKSVSTEATLNESDQRAHSQHGHFIFEKKVCTQAPLFRISKPGTRDPKKLGLSEESH